MVMKKGKYLLWGLVPLALSASMMKPSTSVGNAAQDSAKGIQAASVNDAAKMGAPVNAPLPFLVDGDRVGPIVLVNADANEVIGFLEQLAGKTAIKDAKLPSVKLSINIPEAISRLEAIAALESVLSINGIAIVDLDEMFMKAIAAKFATTHSPYMIEGTMEDIAPSQKICSKFFKLQYLDAGDFQKTIKSILTPGNSNMVLFASANALYIVDTLANLQNVENLIRRTDTPIKLIEEVKFMPLNNVKASAVVKKMEQLKRSALKKYLATTTIDSDDSSNQLIIITAKENLPTIMNIAKQLDNRCELLLRSEVIRIKHGDAKKIADVVSSIIKEQRSRVEKENQMAFERQQAQMSAQGSLANALAQAASGSRSNQQISNSYSEFISTQQIPGELGEEQTAQFSANLTLSSDERSNSIIVYGTSSDLAQVQHLISKLDVLLDQVRIEVIVAEVTLTDDQDSGFSAFNPSFNQKDSPHEVDFGTTFAKATFNGTLKNFSLKTIFNKAKTNNNVKILSTPSLVTTHNRKAQIKIGEQRPFASSSTKSDSKDAVERVNVEYKHVGLQLTVTPLIGNNGIIQMDIEQAITANTAGVTIGGTSTVSPVISEKTINSFVSVADGDVIVMAGFKSKETKKNNDKLFLLGDIPLIGPWLFSPRDRNEDVKELIVFIKPTIILHPQDEAAYLDKRLEVTNFKEDIDTYRLTGDFPKSDPFPKDTIFGLNGQAMSLMAQEKAEAMKANRPRPTSSGRRAHSRKKNSKELTAEKKPVSKIDAEKKASPKQKPDATKHQQRRLWKR
jgi:general secretion pathway protein D